MANKQKLVEFANKKGYKLNERKLISDLVNKLEDEEFFVLKKINNILGILSDKIEAMTRPTNEEILQLCNVVDKVKGYLLDIIEELGISDHEKLETVKLLLSSTKQVLFDLQTCLKNRVNSKAFKKDTADPQREEHTKQLSSYIERSMKNIDETNKFVDNIITKFMELRRMISMGKTSLGES